MEYHEAGLIFSVLETSRDCNEEIRQAIQCSISTLGFHHPDLILSSIYNFLVNQEKPLSNDAKICLYSTINDVIEEVGNGIEDNKIIEKWVSECINLLVSPSAVEGLLAAASEFLSTLVRKHVHLDFVMKELINALPEKQIPNLDIVSTLSMSSSTPKDVIVYFIDILKKIVPTMCLCATKQESLRVTIVHFLRKMAHGILELSANTVDGVDLNLVQYQSIFAVAYEQLLNSWFKLSGVSIKNLIIDALSHISDLLSEEALREYCTPTIHLILGHYKRNPNPFVLSYSLAIFCDAMTQKGIEDCLKPHVESTLATLSNQACSPLDYNDIETVENYGEVLRCYDILALSFPDNVICQVLQRLENASHVQRTGALAVLKHLINRRRIPETFMKRVITNLNLVLTDLNSKVVKNMSQLILTLGNKKLLSIETGRPFIDYLIQHSAGCRLQPKGRIDLAEVCNEPATDVCCEALILLATIPSVVPILWPHMLQYLMNPQLEESLPVVLKCLANLAAMDETKVTSDDVPSVFNQLTPPIIQEAVIVKLLMSTCVPNKSAIGTDCLDLLNGLAGHVSPTLVSSWGDHLPALKTQYADICANTSEPMALEKFQSSLKHFLESTIIAVNSESFIENLISALKYDLERYDKNQAYRCFLMSLMGVCLKYIANAALTSSTLEFLYTTVNHRSSADQESFGAAVGMCASAKTDLVFTKMEAWLKAIDSVKRSILSLLEAQDSRLEEQTFLKISIVHCLGQIAVLAENDKVEETVGGPVMLHLLNIINNNKVSIVNDVVMQTISKISRSLVKIPQMKLRQRPIIITHIVNTMQQEDIAPTALATCLQAMRDIVALQPKLDVEERALVLQTSIVMCLSKINVTTIAELDSNLINCYCILNVLIRTVVLHDPELATIDDIVTLLRPSIQSSSEVIRIKSLDLIHSSLCTFQQDLVVPQGETFTYKALFLAIIAPRLNDSCPEVKIQAVACLKLIMKISDKYYGHSGEFNDIANEAMETLLVKIACSDDEAISANLELMGDIICYKLSLGEVGRFIHEVNVGLQDRNGDAACGVAQIMKTIFNTRGHQMQHFYPKTILEPIYRRLQKVSDPATRYYTVEAICNYAQFKVTRFSNILATFPIPFEKGICETFQRMGGSTDMCVNLLTHFTQVLERTPPYAMQNTANGERVKIANLLPLSVICAMKEMFSFAKIRNDDDERGILLQTAVNDDQVKKTKEEIDDNFASLFPLLVLWYGSYVDCLAPLHQASPTTDIPTGFIPNRDATNVIPARCVLECIKSYLNASGYCKELEDTLEMLLKVPDIESFDSFNGSIGDIVHDFVLYAPDKVSSFVAYLDTHHTYEMQRITVTCVFGTLISVHCNADFELLEMVIASLISRIHDESINVRRLAIRGLAAFNQTGVPEDFEKTSEVLATLVSATELRNTSYIDLDSEIVVEALTGLSTILQRSNFKQIQPHVLVLFNKVRSFLEKPAVLRDAATSLLLSLVAYIEPSVEYKQIIHSHLLGTLIHLLDPHVPVAVTCIRILLHLDKHLDSVRLCNKFNDHLSVTKEINYPKFIEEIAPFLVEELGGYLPTFVQSAIGYYRHSSATMRRASVILTAYVVNSAEDLDLTIVKKAAQGLNPLLKDSVVEVASAAVLAVSLYKRHTMLL